MRRFSKQFLRGGRTIVAIPVLADNFVYLLARDQGAVLIDAGAMPPVAACLEKNRWCLHDIFVTHRHADHIAGYDSLQNMVKPREAKTVDVVHIIDVPGHTCDDKAYYFPEAGVVFTGDCVINGACGRVLGGDLEVMFASLQKITSLPSDTLVLGGHDYLLDNLRFAQQHEPENAAIQARMDRYQEDPAGALFVPLAEEMASNPFLRASDVSAFTALREAKDRFG